VSGALVSDCGSENAANALCACACAIVMHGPTFSSCLSPDRCCHLLPVYLSPRPPQLPVPLSRIGYLEQEPQLDAGATVADNIAPAVQHIK
jgi:hypothetical protein